MNNFEKQREIYSKKYDEELMKTGIFFAFSKEQFQENKIPKEAQDNEFIFCGMGGYIHESNKKKLDEFFKTTEKQLKKELKDNTTIEEMIQYELINHECYYTQEPFEIIALIKGYYGEIPEEEIKSKIESIYSKNYEKNQEIWGT